MTAPGRAFRHDFILIFNSSFTRSFNTARCFLAVMGGACLVNARGCGRMHCYFTGPFFLAMAVASLAYGLHWVPLGAHGWLYLGAVLLAGGGLFGFVLEWLWGRYLSAKTDSHGQ